MCFVIVSGRVPASGFRPFRPSVPLFGVCGPASAANDLPEDVLGDLANHTIECTDPEWDEYEQSTLRRLANSISIGIRGDTVDLTVTKTFA